MERFLKLVETVNTGIGKVSSFACPLIVLLVIYEVTLRSLFRKSTFWIFDMNIYLYAIIFMLAMAYTNHVRGHVSVDLIYGRLSRKKRSIIELFGHIVLGLPFCFVLIWYSGIAALQSWQQGETAQLSSWDSPLYLAKALLPLGFFLLFLSIICNLIQDLNHIIKGEKP